MTIFGIVLYIVIYFIMPRAVDETIEIGFYSPQALKIFNEDIAEQGLIIRYKKTEHELKQAITDKEFPVGISIPDDILKSFKAGEKLQLFVYYSSEVPGEMKDRCVISIFTSNVIYNNNWQFNTEQFAHYIYAFIGFNDGHRAGIFHCVNFTKHDPCIVFMFPDIPKWIGMFSPTYYVMNPIMEITRKGGDWSTVKLDVFILIGILAVFCLIVGAIAIKTIQ